MLTFREFTVRLALICLSTSSHLFDKYCNSRRKFEGTWNASSILHACMLFYGLQNYQSDYVFIIAIYEKIKCNPHGCRWIKLYQFNRPINWLSCRPRIEYIESLGRKINFNKLYQFNIFNACFLSLVHTYITCMEIDYLKWEPLVLFSFMTLQLDNFDIIGYFYI